MTENELRDEEQKQLVAQQRAEQARVIIEDSMVIQAFTDMEEGFLNVIVESPLGQPEDRENAYRMIRLMRTFKGHFQKTMEDGKFAKHRIAQIKGDRENKIDRPGP